MIKWFIENLLHSLRLHLQNGPTSQMNLYVTFTFSNL